MEQFTLAKILDDGGATPQQRDEVLEIFNQGKYTPETVERRRPKFYVPSNLDVTVCEGTPHEQKIRPRLINTIDIKRLLAFLPEARRHLFGEDNPDGVKEVGIVDIAAQIFEGAIADHHLGKITVFTDLVYAEICEFINLDTVVYTPEDIESLPVRDQRKLFWGIVEANKQDFLDLLAPVFGAIQGQITMPIGISTKHMSAPSSLPDTTNSDGGVTTSGFEISPFQSLREPVPVSHQ